MSAIARRLPAPARGGSSKAAVPARRAATEVMRQAPEPQFDLKSLGEPRFAHDFSHIEASSPAEIAAAPVVFQALKSHAQPLSPAYRQGLGARLGADLADVRVHTGRDAAIAAMALDAEAFTVGSHVVLGDAPMRRQLLVHELVHVAQQPRAAGAPSRILSQPGDSAEREADSVTSNPRPVTGAPSALIHRQRRSTPIPGWNFTPLDFAMMKVAGGTLTIAADSGFFPPRLQENLMKTLAYVLGPTISPPATEGINALDFFHGHLVVKKDPATARQAAAAERKGEAFMTQLGTERTRALGRPVRFGTYPLTSTNIGAYQKAVAKVLPSFGTLLDDTSKLPGAAVMYHTFEFNQPTDRQVLSLGSEDPRRHYVTPLDTNQPRQYSPPAGGYETEYTHVTRFVFLVDDQRAIHVRPFDPSTGYTTLELSTITGTTFPEPLERETIPAGDYPVPGVERPLPTNLPT
jgi:hypothetical protein